VVLTTLGGCGKPQPTSVQVDPGLSILIPPDTKTVIALNADKLRETDLFKKHLAGRSLPQLDEFGKFTGIDVRKDLWQLLFLSDGKHEVALARGKFADEMESKLERDGAKVIGHKMYHIVGQDQGAVVFFNSSTAAVGNVESLRALIDTRGQTNGPPEPIAQRMKEIPKDVQFWGVSIGGPMPAMGLPGNLANVDTLLGLVNSGYFYFDLRNGLKGLTRFAAGNDADGKRVHDALRGFIGLGRLMTPPNQPDLLHVFDGLQVSQQGQQVDLQIDVAPDLVDKLVEHAAGLAGRETKSTR
jgi:hypothetical protein